MSLEKKRDENIEEKEAEASKESPKESKKEEKKKALEKDQKIALYEKQLDELKKDVVEYKEKFETADRQADEWKNKYYQAYADMSNTRKQVDRETSDFKKYACQDLIEEIIPTLDAFDMALKTEPKDDVTKRYLEGFKMIHSKLLNTLTQAHVEIISPKIGDDFDHNTMQAFSTVDGEEDDKVADVFMKGYKMYDHLLREAGVIITKKKVVEEENKAEEAPSAESGKEPEAK